MNKIQQLEQKLNEQRNKFGLVGAKRARVQEFDDADYNISAGINPEDWGIEINLKYIDPSYMIRSVPATANDSVFCGFLGQEAVHAGMAGKTNMVVGSLNDQFVYIPIKEIVKGRKQVDLNGKLWRSVLEATGQPSFMQERGSS